MTPWLRWRLNMSPGVPMQPVKNERDHFYTCRGCGQRVDMRRLGDVFHHEEPGHRPIEAGGCRGEDQ